ncbi:MAG: TRAP transporter fused permease subunit [Burkholderiales bacterium]|nr:TRAP transporter fused permease subunit [Burkholderiales bacterium]OJX03758.1 MAG: C4-dicarboxylate ABC transporter permease [Burkholderiales bacterium 70-64]
MSAAGGPDVPGQVSEERRQAAERFIEEEEGATSRFGGALSALITTLLVVMSLFHLYAAAWIVPTLTLRPVHVGFMLLLIFLTFPATPRLRNRLMWYDVALAALGVATIVYLLWGGDDFWDRSTMPDRWDVVFGVAFVVLVLEAARRSTGWIMPAVVLLFGAYAFLGPWLPGHWAHRGYDIPSMVGVMYMSLEGVFGTAIDVSATLIIMFTIFGAFLQHSGAGKFFLDFSFALLGGRRSGAGRTVVLSSFLLGGPSGSGVATTVTIGTVAWPMLERAGYDRNSAGGLLAAGGLGAIISPPVLGAAAFLIAEFLKISYLDVLRMAVIPTCLYYLSLFLMVEIDARKFGSRAEAEVKLAASAGQLARRFWFHFLSLVAIIGFMVYGFSPLMSVFWATVVAFAVSFFDRETAMWPPRLIAALADGSKQALNVAATCAAAGIIVGVVGKTGLGLKFSSIVIAYAGGSLLLTAIYTSLIVWVIGLAVPVTASYIICAVIAAPALTKLGVPDFAAHMFIFYYAVLSEVSPPTALSPFAAAAITNGDPYRTTLQSWKYTLPAFLLPFVFVLDPAGAGLLLTPPAGVSWWEVAWVVLTASIGIAALAGGAQNWVLLRCALWERLALIAAGLLLVYPHAWADASGLALVALALASQWLRARSQPTSERVKES